MKKWHKVIYSCLGVMVLLALILYGSFEALYYFGQKSMWKDIENPSALVNDCKMLIEQKEKGTIEFFDKREGFKLEGTLKESFWPNTIRNLNPISVSVEKESVSIMLSTGGIGACFGYLISFKEILNAPTNYKKWPIINGLHLQKSKYPNIYKWQGVE